MSIFNYLAAKYDPEKLSDFLYHFFISSQSPGKHYAINNCLLIYGQRPGAVMLETEYGWSKYGRFVKPSANPIVILQQGGPVNFIYDYEDTEGDPIPFCETPILSIAFDSSYSSETVTEHWVLALVEAVRNNHIAYEEGNPGTGQYAQINYLDHTISYYVHKKNKLEKIVTNIKITANKNKDPFTKFHSIIHELGHLFCGHLPSTNALPSKFTVPHRDLEILSTSQMEYEAELTTFYILKVLGFQADVTPYLNDYLLPDGSVPEVDTECISLAMQSILSFLPYFIKPNNNVETTDVSDTKENLGPDQ